MQSLTKLILKNANEVRSTSNPNPDQLVPPPNFPHTAHLSIGCPLMAPNPPSPHLTPITFIPERERSINLYLIRKVHSLPFTRLREECKWLAMARFCAPRKSNYVKWGWAKSVACAHVSWCCACLVGLCVCFCGFFFAFFSFFFLSGVSCFCRLILSSTGSRSVVDKINVQKSRGPPQSQVVERFSFYSLCFFRVCFFKIIFVKDWPLTSPWQK